MSDKEYMECSVVAYPREIRFLHINGSVSSYYVDRHISDYVDRLQKENQELKKQLEEVEFIVGLRQKRNLIHKFDKEYDEEDKKKNPNRDYAGIMPDAEEVYRRYYTMKNQQKEFIDYMEDKINKIKEEIRTFDIWHEVGVDINFLILKKQFFIETLSKYKEIIGGNNGI